MVRSGGPGRCPPVVGHPDGFTKTRLWESHLFQGGPLPPNPGLTTHHPASHSAAVTKSLGRRFPGPCQSVTSPQGTWQQISSTPTSNDLQPPPWLRPQAQARTGAVAAHPVCSAPHPWLRVKAGVLTLAPGSLPPPATGHSPTATLLQPGTSVSPLLCATPSRRSLLTLPVSPPPTVPFRGFSILVLSTSWV